MGFEYVVKVLRVVESDANKAFLTGWCHQDRLVLAIRVQSAETFGIIASVNGVHKAKI